MMGSALHLRQVELATRARRSSAGSSSVFLAIVQWRSRSAFARCSARLWRQSRAEPTESTMTSARQFGEQWPGIERSFGQPKFKPQNTRAGGACFSLPSNHRQKGTRGFEPSVDYLSAEIRAPYGRVPKKVAAFSSGW